MEVCRRSISIFVVLFLLANTAYGENSSDAPSASYSPSKALSKLSSILKKSGISKVPSTSSVIKSSSTSSNSLSEKVSVSTVSGTPPKLIDIPNQSIKDLFWRGNIVEDIATGNPTREQCDEFFGGAVDGTSGGLGACHMVEGVGHSFETLLRSETSLCYMRNLPTKSNLKSGGITFVKGKAPDNDITKLFAPGEKTRIVKVIHEELGGERDISESIYIKIPSTTQNEAKSLLYRADIYFCPDEGEGPRGFNVIKVKSNGQLQVMLRDDSREFGQGSNEISVTGFLKASGNSVTFDTSKTRKSTLSSVRNSDKFKSQFTIGSDNIIELKNVNIFENDFGSNTNKTYVLSRFTGSNVSTVSFLEGGFKGENGFGDDSKEFSGATEFRDPKYLSAPSNSLKAQAASYDISGDSFYTSPPETDVDVGGYSCTVKTNIEIRMNKGQGTLEESLKPCFEQEQNFRSMEFCRNEPTVQLAQRRFRQACDPLHP